MCCLKLDGGLGFKDLESFNLVLSAKQWWRVIRNENSLSYRMLKRRYFPNTTPMKVLKKIKFFIHMAQFVRREKSCCGGICLEGG